MAGREQIAENTRFCPIYLSLTVALSGSKCYKEVGENTFSSKLIGSNV